MDEIQKFFFDSQELCLLHTILKGLFDKLKTECVRTKKPIKKFAPQKWAKFRKKNFGSKSQPQRILTQNPDRIGPLGGIGSQWTQPHISTPRPQFSDLTAFLGTDVLIIVYFKNQNKL